MQNLQQLPQNNHLVLKRQNQSDSSCHTEPLTCSEQDKQHTNTELNWENITALPGVSRTEEADFNTEDCYTSSIMGKRPKGGIWYAEEGEEEQKHLTQLVLQSCEESGFKANYFQANRQWFTSKNTMKNDTGGAGEVWMCREEKALVTTTGSNIQRWGNKALTIWRKQLCQTSSNINHNYSRKHESLCCRVAPQSFTEVHNHHMATCF